MRMRITLAVRLGGAVLTADHQGFAALSPVLVKVWEKVWAGVWVAHTAPPDYGADYETWTAAD